MTTCELCGELANVEMALEDRTAWLCSPCWIKDDRDVVYGEFGSGE